MFKCEHFVQFYRDWKKCIVNTILNKIKNSDFKSNKNCKLGSENSTRFSAQV